VDLKDIQKNLYKTFSMVMKPLVLQEATLNAGKQRAAADRPMLKEDGAPVTPELTYCLEVNASFH